MVLSAHLAVIFIKKQMGAELQRAAMICTREDPECHVIYEEGGET